MSFKDFFKDSVWNSFSANNGITASFIVNCLIALAIAVILGFCIYKIYGHFYGGVVYSSSFAVTLIGMTVLTCMLTLAISSNIVISLGMVGALSIVRYRTAVKDPMDLLYLFWSISVGICVAANLYIIAALTMIVMLLIVHFFYHKRKAGVIYILVAHYEGEQAGDAIMKELAGIKYQLRSKTIHGGKTEMTIELLSRHGNTTFADKIEALEGVKDVSLIQYNGEYNG